MSAVSIISKGFLLSGGLIAAIGSQNAFVLKQGLRKQHIFSVCLCCFLCDFFLIILGVYGIGSSITSSMIFSKSLALLGAIFLSVYGIRSLKNALTENNVLEASNENSKDLLKTVLTALAMSLLNPHVYLDTVVVLGGVARTIPSEFKSHFTLGALLASSTWFFTLGYGSRKLIPLFKRPATWKALDSLTAFIMFWIVYELIKFVCDTNAT